MDEKRFVKIYSQGGFVNNVMEIWVDIKTGVNYLFPQSGYAGGLTPLLKADGIFLVPQGRKTPVPKVAQAF